MIRFVDIDSLMTIYFQYLTYFLTSSLLTFSSAYIVSGTKLLTFHLRDLTYNIPLTILLGIVIVFFFLYVLWTRIRVEGWTRIRLKSPTEYFEGAKPQRLINEYTGLSYLLFISLGVFIILITVYTFKFGYGSLDYIFTFSVVGKSDDQTRFNTGVTLWFYIFYSLLLRYSITWYRDFHYYIARAYIKSIPSITDEVVKIVYLTIGLNSYDRYIQKALSLRINGIQKFYSSITADSPENQSKSINSICNAFNGDKLKPLRELSSIMKVNNTEWLLIKQPVEKKIKDWGVLIAAIIPVILTLLQLAFPKIFPKPP